MGQREGLPERLLTPRLCLRPWREADAPAYRDLWLERDPRSLRLVGADGRPTVGDLRGVIASHREAARTGLGLSVVERRADRHFLGYCGLLPRESTPQEPELVYELLRSAHGNGYATEAALAVRDAAAAAGRRRLWAGVRAWNAASLRVLDKLGFVPSGEVRPDPERGDLVLMTCRLA